MSKLSMENISNTSNGLENFLQIFIAVLDKHVPQKKKYNRGNNMPLVNKPLLARAHMKRNRLRNRFWKNRSKVNRINYIKQRNYRVNLLRKTKEQYYANLNKKDVADNKKFWETVKHLLLSDKIKSNSFVSVDEVLKEIRASVNIFCLKSKNAGFFWIKLWKNHIFIFMSNFVIFLLNNADMKILSFGFFSLGT